MEFPKTAAERIVGIMREQRAKSAADSKPRVEEEKATTVSFKAVAIDELGVIIGIGAAAGSPTQLDLDGEFLEKADVIKMCFDFTSSANRSFKANHLDDVDAKLVMSWAGSPIVKVDKATRLLDDGEALTDSMEVVGIGLDVSKASHWFVGIQPSDPAVLEAAKAGEIVGFSWAGLVNKELVS